MGRLLGAFAFASDLAFGLQMEDCLRSCLVAMRLAERLSLPPEGRTAVYYAALLKDAGCTSATAEFSDFIQADEIAARRELVIFGDARNVRNLASWLRRHVAPDKPPLTRLATQLSVLLGSDHFRQAYEASCEVMTRLSARLGMPDSVVTALFNVYERWDGKGAPRGLSGERIPLVSRIVFPTFTLVPFHRVWGRQSAIDLAKKLGGGAFDPDVADAFLALAASESFWEELENGDIIERVAAIEPDSPLKAVEEEHLDDVALAFADFTDLKSRYTAAHSRRVAQVAEQIGHRLRLSADEVAATRRAALMHDLGLVGVPSYALDKPAAQRSQTEAEQVNLHPYLGERILGRVAGLATLSTLVGGHHERLDGQGFYKGLRGAEIPRGARIIAVANRWDELTHDGPDAPALAPRAALAVLESEAGAGLDRTIVEALRQGVEQVTTGRNPAHQWPAGLTEREVEVLQLASRGLTRKKIGSLLSISENTVRHHLEHIYNKTGTTTRVAATVFAMENGLLP